MVNGFLRVQLSAQMYFHHVPVLQHPTCSLRTLRCGLIHSDISITGHFPCTDGCGSCIMLALIGTEFIFVELQRRRAHPEIRSAVFTGKLHLATSLVQVVATSRTEVLRANRARSAVRNHTALRTRNSRPLTRLRTLEVLAHLGTIETTASVFLDLPLVAFDLCATARTCNVDSVDARSSDVRHRNPLGRCSMAGNH